MGIERAQQANATIAQMAERFSRCFFVWGYQRRPLKIGVFDDLLPLVPIAADDLKVALRCYVRSDGYLVACREGAPRIDLAGNTVGEVTAKESAYARKVLADREARRAKKKAASERQTVGAQRCLTTTPARPSGSAAGHHEPGASEVRQPVKRIGFDDLRAAAVRRREAAGAA
jgi:sRNA-binding protein